MDKRARRLLLTLLLFSFSGLPSRAADARFDLVGPRIDVRVTRIGADGSPDTLPIASVPNLQPGDKLWIHPDLPATQSVKYLLICVFLRGTTNPPPDSWFLRIDTWDRKVRAEGTFITVPAEAQQALLFMAPETGGDFATLKSAVQGRPGAFVRASQDLTEAGFEQARIEKYLASIRRVPPSDPAELQKHSDLLSRTLALKPNADCFKRSVDVQFTCLTQTGSQVVMDDGHGQNIVNALSTGPGSDFIQQASYTNALGAGVYSAYVGAIVDLVRIMSNLHTAQYQYIPAISFPQAESMNLRLNTPPSFHNPKSVLVIALPSVQTAVPPPLRPADLNHVACLLEPSAALPIEGAPLVFSADFAHNLMLHLNTPPGAPAEPDIPLIADAYSGGLLLQHTPEHHVPLRDPLHDPLHDAGSLSEPASPFARPDLARPALLPPPAASKLAVGTPPPPPQPEPVTLTGTIVGRWGFDPFTGPTVPLQQLPGGNWTVTPVVDNGINVPITELIAGHTAQLHLTSTGSACVHTITARPTGSAADIHLTFAPEPKPDQPNLLVVTLPQNSDVKPGDLHLAILQFDQPKADEVAARTFAEPAHIVSAELHAGDRSILLGGSQLTEVEKLQLGDLTFMPTPPAALTPTGPADDISASDSALRLLLADGTPSPTLHLGDHLAAKVVLRDGRSIALPITVSSPRPAVTLIGKTPDPAPNSNIALTDPNDLALSSRLTFTLKSPNPFPRNGRVEVETLDGTLRTVLTLAPSGGLVLQDPHTVVATLDPLRSFGPSAFGAVHLRAIYPGGNHSRPAETMSPPGEQATAQPTIQPAPPVIPAQPGGAPNVDDVPAGSSSSDWLPLATLVRLPELAQLQCPVDAMQPCMLTGAKLYLLQAISTDPAFADPVVVPDGFTGTALAIPHPSAATVFLRLRDDPAPIDSAILPPPHTAKAPPKQKSPAPAPDPSA